MNRIVSFAVCAVVVLLIAGPLLAPTRRALHMGPARPSWGFSAWVLLALACGAGASTAAAREAPAERIMVGAALAADAAPPSLLTTVPEPEALAPQ